MDYRIQLWLKDEFLCHLIDMPIPRVGDLVRTCNTESYKVDAVSFTYNIGETDSCVVDIHLVEVEE